MADTTRKFGSTLDCVAAERARIETVRRVAVPPTAGRPGGTSHWALALSGGGIRSATFSLGVLQALAKASAPVAADAAAPAPAARLLREFDYLSTVSGGGYIGAFFASLFIPGRASGDDTESAAQAARRAYEVLREDPPGRMRSSEALASVRPASKALAWLRENGRYLAPTGAGDLFQVMALQLRNWMAVHYVLGIFLLALIAGLALGKVGLDLYLDLPQAPWHLPGQPAEHFVWWSPFWALAAIVALTCLVPFGIAYWLSHLPPRPWTRNERLGRVFSSAVVCNFVIALVLFGLAIWLATGNRGVGRPELLAGIACGLGAVTLLATVFHLLVAWRAHSVEAQRLQLTRGLAVTLKWALVCVAVAALDTASQSVYMHLMRPEEALWKYFSPAALLGAIVWLVRKGASWSGEGGAPGWTAKIPLDVLAGTSAMALLALVALAWAVLAQWVLWQGGAPVRLEGQAALAHAWWTGGFLVLALALAVVSGQFPGFINESSLQSFYAARLTRAYLGGSNARRFLETALKWSSVAEPHKDDAVSRERYFRDDVAAPLHLINVTMNQTVDPAEQLVQRDRKGKPMAVGPAGYLVDRKFYRFAEAADDLSIGHWIGTSGAAFTTGLGRATSLGMSLLLGLANVRLGTWWRSGLGDNTRARPVERLLLWALKTQTYLLYEFSAHFHGNHRRWQYLSDGGHFENTGVYELLRPERDTRLVLACDNGCDERYQFNDLANLIRLARIDHGAEVELVPEVCEVPLLKDVFGTDAELRAARPGEGGKCALLLKVAYPARPELAPRYIVVVKPRLVAGVPLDVAEYQQRFPAFPQQSTLDQFFDEAQWESHRKLGLEIGTRVFDGARGAALWAFLATRLA